MGLGRDPHEILFSGENFSIPGLDQEIDDKAQFEHAFAEVFPAIADRFGIDDDLLAVLELLRPTFLVKTKTARLAVDEQCPADRQRRLLPGFDHGRLAAVDFLERLGVDRADAQQHSKQQ